MTKHTCKFSGCVKPVLARKMCSTHYGRWRSENPGAVRKCQSNKGRVCSAAGCSEEANARGLCVLHYSRLYWRLSRERVLERERAETTVRLRSTVKSCKQCDREFSPKRTMAQVYCSGVCARKWRRENNTKFCETDGCLRPLQARGMCGKHYKEWYVENNPGVDPNPKHEMQCAVCGKTVVKVKSGPRAAVCSYGCRYVLVWGQTKAEADAERARRARSAHRQLVVRPSLRFRLVIKYPEDTYRSVRFTSVRCGPCGEYFVWDNRITTSFAKYCSDTCRTSAFYARRALRGGVDYRGRSISSAVRRGVYERDGWVCQLCFEPVVETEKFGRWSPTLDHIIPRSMQLVPDHSPSNLRLAHNYCNAIRGDGSGTNLPIGREALSA